MHTSGLILTVTDPADLRELSASGPFTPGELVGRCVPGVLEVVHPRAAHEWHDWATTLPGVESVEVVFVHWEGAETDA